VNDERKPRSQEDYCAQNEITMFLKKDAGDEGKKDVKKRA